MVSSSADNANTDSISFIPASVAINNIDSVSSIQIVDCTLSVDPPYLPRKRLEIGAEGT